MMIKSEQTTTLRSLKRRFMNVSYQRAFTEHSERVASGRFSDLRERREVRRRGVGGEGHVALAQRPEGEA